jgi:phosphoribosyl 1,2-cyclic phosphodiesterase
MKDLYAIMALLAVSLNSGSNGNCYFIGYQDEAILVDAGLSCRETVHRLNRCGLSMDAVKAILITHEHRDHIHGISGICQKYSIPVYISEKTYNACHIFTGSSPVIFFKSDEPVTIGRFTLTGFLKSHDAADPHSCLITSDDTTVGVFTDIGRVCSKVISYFRKCNAVFLECNYDEELLMKGSYPFPLKNRIRGGKGHLSNLQALELFIKYRSPFLTHVFLSHLSQDNNSPELAGALFRQHAQGTSIHVLSRYHESAVFQLQSKTPSHPIQQKIQQTKPAITQLTLF